MCDHRLKMCIGCVKLVGSNSPKKRQKAIDAFQQHPECRVFIGPKSAVGTGYNLTAVSYVFFLGLPWTPGCRIKQRIELIAMGNTHGGSQNRLAEDTIDQQLRQMLIDKRALAVI
ncbi:hypothetical protein BKM17_12445 [Pseudomonas syringae group genomosp. 3]|nr:hypothetical protein BKM17_12445 [Pseudomonas syringae group genomosp. 3]